MKRKQPNTEFQHLLLLASEVNKLQFIVLDCSGLLPRCMLGKVFVQLDFMLMLLSLLSLCLCLCGCACMCGVCSSHASVIFNVTELVFAVVPLSTCLINDAFCVCQLRVCMCVNMWPLCQAI